MFEHALKAWALLMKTWETEDKDIAPIMVVQSVGLIHDIPSCADLVKTIMAEAENTINDYTGRIQTS